MTPDGLLRLYPRATPRWLRLRLWLIQEALAFDLGVRTGTVTGWETRRSGIAPHNRAQLAAMLVAHLATLEIDEFVRSFGCAEAPTLEG